MTLVDQDNRHRAMTDFTSVLLVEAAAGTGKTSLMAGRVAMMLASGYHPGDIAAITFTELAASQLAGRICAEDLGCCNVCLELKSFSRK